MRNNNSWLIHFFLPTSGCVVCDSRLYLNVPSICLIHGYDQLEGIAITQAQLKTESTSSPILRLLQYCTVWRMVEFSLTFIVNWLAVDGSGIIEMASVSPI